MAMLNAKHVGTRQSSRLLYRPVYKEMFSPPGVTDEQLNVFHDALPLIPEALSPLRDI